MFVFAICLILIFLFDETFSKSTEIQHQNSQQFWHNFMQENGIWDEQIKQMADEMDESDTFIEKLSNEENYPPQSSEHPALEKTYSYKFNHNSTPNELKHPGKQSINKMTQKDKNEGKNRRSKRLAAIFILAIGVLVAFVCFLIFAMFVFKNLSD
uniref:Uncharacterized protein n=1 Tax=Globodera rostochiensis TaxID=31243 RepID=A0A914H6G0_GLORO